MKTFTKTTFDELDYSIDWTDWLGGDTIATSIWFVPDGLAKELESNTNTLTTVWLSGGTDKKTYTVRNLITTSGGRTKKQSIKIRMERAG